MNMKIIIISALLLCSGLQAQEAGSMEFLHETTSANVIEKAVTTVKGLFKKQEKNKIKLSLNVQKTGVFAAATTCFAVWAILNKYFNANVEDTEEANVTADATTQEDVTCAA